MTRHLLTPGLDNTRLFMSLTLELELEHESSVFISKSHIMAVTLLSGGYIFYLMSTLDPTDPSLMAYLLSVILILMNLVILLVTAPRLSWRYTLSPVHLSHGLLSHGPLPLVSFLSHGHIPVMAVRLDPTISRNKTPDLETEVRLR